MFVLHSKIYIYEIVPLRTSGLFTVCCNMTAAEDAAEPSFLLTWP